MNCSTDILEVLLQCHSNVCGGHFVFGAVLTCYLSPYVVYYHDTWTRLHYQPESPACRPISGVQVLY